MNIVEAKEILNKVESCDDEMFHVKFDEILEKRLMELDTHFMRAMRKLYKKSGLNRWFA